MTHKDRTGNPAHFAPLILIGVALGICQTNCPYPESFVEFQNHLWFVIGTSLYATDNDYNLEYVRTIENEYHNIQLYSFKDLWVVSRRDAVYRFDGTSWYTYRPYQAGYDCWLYSDKRDTVWLVSYGRGIAVFNGAQWNTFDVPAQYISAIAVDTGTGIWIGTDDAYETAGACYFDGTDWTCYNADSALVGNYTMDIAIDSMQNVWFATSEGISCFNGQYWRSWTQDDGLLEPYVMEIHVGATGDIWFGTEKGVYRWDGATLSSYTGQEFLYNDFVNTIYADKNGSIFCFPSGFRAGFSKFDGTQWMRYDSIDVRAKTLTKDGELLVSGQRFVVNYSHADADTTWLNCDMHIKSFRPRTLSNSPNKLNSSWYTLLGQRIPRAVVKRNSHKQRFSINAWLEMK